MTEPASHGNRRAYLGGCRCRPCTDAQTAYNTRRERLIAYGRWKPYVDAQPAREHVLALVEQGLSWRRTAELAGVAKSTVSSLLFGKSGKKPTAQLRPRTAEAILAVRGGLDARTFGSRVDATGTTRRVQALVANGWSLHRLAAEIDMTPGNLHSAISRPQVWASTARKVRDLYERLWNAEPPAGTPDERGAITRSLNRARAHGWLPPMAWDDEDLDDPTAVPDRSAVRRDRSRRRAS